VKSYPTHYALAKALTRRGFVADMFDPHRFSRADGVVVHATFAGSWKVEARA
jgi:hypothetical protein